MTKIKKLILLFVTFMILSGFIPVFDRNTRSYYEKRREIVWEVPMKEKFIALTFDDGPSMTMTPQILDLLNKHHAKATFFVVGKKGDACPEILKREAQEGHEIGNHTYSHLSLLASDGRNKLDTEIKRTENSILKFTGQHCRLFRPPEGIYNEWIIKTAKSNGYLTVLWSWHQDTTDWRMPGTSYIIKKVLKNARNGDIVLFHDEVPGSSQTLEALRIILPILKKRGFQMLTVSELVKHRAKAKTTYFKGKKFS